MNVRVPGAYLTRGLDPMDGHPHSMQHKAITNLQGSIASQMSSGNYSRTPELRVSHKMAERKRRSEMKDLFDTLNRTLPNSPGNKSSKWEILSKGMFPTMLHFHLLTIGSYRIHHKSQGRIRHLTARRREAPWRDRACTFSSRGKPPATK